MKKKNTFLQRKNRHIFRLSIYAVLFLMLGFVSCETSTLSELAEDGDEENAPEVVTYENTARAILDNACVECHNINNQTAGVRLDAFEFAFLEADSGIMLARMTNTTNPMPPSGNLPDNLIEDISDWINDGILEN